MRDARLHAITTALAVAALAGAMALGTQIPAAAANCAHPRIKVLDTLTDPQSGGTVTALGRGTIAAGNSAGVPAYWIDTTVHKIPFPAGYGSGTVTAVNRHDLMVGTVAATSGSDRFAFSYRLGAKKAKILPGGAYAADVNDSGQIVGGGPFPDDRVYVWHGTTVQRELTIGPGFVYARVTGINNAGTIIGTSDYYLSGFPDIARVGLVWQSGTTGPAIPLLPIDSSSDSGISYAPEDIAENGRIVGEKESFWNDASYETVWDAPYTADATEVPGLPGYGSEGYFHAISPTTGLIAGEAPTNYSSEPPAGTAEIWTGSGPILALPALVPGTDTGAEAAADNGDVGGYAVDSAGALSPVIWTCAVEQAFHP